MEAWLWRTTAEGLRTSCSRRPLPRRRSHATAPPMRHGCAVNAGGHYTANVRQPDGRWLLYNDAYVSFVEERRVLQERPYLLFYERQHHG